MEFKEDPTDSALGLILLLFLTTCGTSIFLTALFPCSCNPRRDCKRSCADCKRDREKFWKRVCKKRERASTEESLVENV
jgi:hypothetical protein